MRSIFAYTLALALAVVLVFATAPIPGLVREAQAAPAKATTYSLMLSKSPDRSGAVPLNGQTVSGNIYVFITPDSGLTQVNFFFDNPSASGTPRQTENTAPWDFAGGSATAANAFDTRTVNNSGHSISASITDSSGAKMVVTAYFNVNNTTAASTPTPAPTAPPAAQTVYNNLVSRTSDRSAASQLNGQTVSGNIYVFVSPDSGITQVNFFLDNQSASGTPRQTENTAPWDFAGGSATAANAFDTRTVSNGGHSITASVALSSGARTVTTSYFTVNNTTATSTPPPAPAPSGSIYWGVNMYQVPWQLSVLTSWEQNVTGKAVSIVHWGHTWDQNGGYRPWASGPANNARSHGSIPMISWTPQGGDETRWQLHRITAGEHDAYIRQFATDLKNWGLPVFIRLMHEMNGNWGFPWQEDANRNKRGEFVPAWQHIVNIFKSVGANNVSWVWCPNVDYSGSGRPSFASLYPGDSYVDWTCLDGYNWGTTGTWGSKWESFDSIYNYSYNQALQVAPSKPVMVGEFGSVEQGGSKAAWFTDVLTTQLPSRYPRVRAVVYFNWAAGAQDWRIETTTTASTAWRNGIGSSYYAANKYGSITGKVAVP